MSEDLHLLVGAYAIDALDDSERELFEDHLADCATCAADLPGLVFTVAGLGAAASAPPPPGLKADVLARLDSVRQLPPKVVPQHRLSIRRERRSIRLALSVAAAAVVLAAIGATWSTVRYRDSERRQDQIAASQQTVARILASSDATTLRPAEPAWASARIVFSPSLGKAVLVADGLTAPPAGRTYEAWVIVGGAPKAAGTFEPVGDRAVSRVLEGPTTGVQAIAITVEPDGGRASPSGKPVATFAVPA